MANPFKISVLISGGGTTLRNLIEQRSRNQLAAEIANVISNNPDAGGLQFAADAKLESVVINHKTFDDVDSFSQAVFDQCRSVESELVVMGGFLRRLKIPSDFTNRVINIHPSLIPAFCGKGQYGARVHRAVLEYGCKLSGCTAHYVDDHYDHGPIIAQEAVPVISGDTPESLAKRVFAKECELYPRVINLIANGKVTVNNRQVTIS